LPIPIGLLGVLVSAGVVDLVVSPRLSFDAFARPHHV